MEEKRLKVSDWSQPIKLILMVIFSIGTLALGLKIINLLHSIITLLQSILFTLTQTMWT